MLKTKSDRESHNLLRYLLILLEVRIQSYDFKKIELKNDNSNES